MTNEILKDEQLDNVAGGLRAYDDMNSYIYVDEQFFGDSSQFRSFNEDRAMTIATNNYKIGYRIR